jgi:hypothetical protein
MESAYKAATKTGAYVVSRVSQATKLKLIHQAKSSLPLIRNKLPPQELAKIQVGRIE